MLRLPIKALQEAKLAYTEFRNYLQALVDAERNHIEDSRTGLNSVLKALVDNSVDNPSSKERRVLTNEELIGNAFVILLGGHESTYTSPLSH